MTEKKFGSNRKPGTIIEGNFGSNRAPGTVIEGNHGSNRTVKSAGPGPKAKAKAKTPNNSAPKKRGRPKKDGK